jgi:hypothetical protein
MKLSFAALVCFLTLLTGCGSGNGFALHPQQFSVSGTLSGLTAGEQLTVSDNGGDAITLAANGSFTFPPPVNSGANYSVAVSSQPPTQTCTVANGSGTASANVTNVTVTCSTNTYTVGGTISGLTGTVILQSNGTNNLPLSANGSFTFSTHIALGSTYNVTVESQPAGQTCTVVNGSGTMGGANVTNVAVTCAINTYTVGGTISGLTGTVILQNNGANNLAENANGSFTFTTPVAEGSTYNVTVLTQPAGQTCTIANGSGTMGEANVNNVNITCTANVPTVSSLTPTAGSIAGGTSVTVIGTKFVVGNTSVTIGGTVIPAGSVTVNSGTSLTFTTPAHAAGAVAVSVIISGGTSAPVPGGFTYIPAYAYVSNSTIPGTISMCPMTGDVLGACTAFTDPNNTLEAPSTIALNSAGTWAYITNDFSTGGVSAGVSTCPITNGQFSGGCTQYLFPGIFNEPSAIALNNAGTKAYVTNANGNTVSVCTINSPGVIVSCIDSGVGTTYFMNPVGIMVNNAGTMAYIANGGSGGSPAATVALCQISSTTGEFTSCSNQTSNSISVTFTDLGGIALNTLGTMGYITSTTFDSSTANVYGCPINPNGTFGTCFNAGNTTFNSFTAPQGIVLNSAGNTAYVADASYNSFTLSAVLTCPIDPVTGIFKTCAVDTDSTFTAPQGITLNTLIK